MKGLTILIPTLPTRKSFYERLTDHLLRQAERNNYEGDVIFATDDSTDCSIGVKRNRLMEMVYTDYICFIDDDDRIAANYIELIMAGIATNPDCCSLNGIMTTDGKDPKPFKHSIDYTSMYETDGIYYRPPNHLNTVRASIAKQMTFPDWQRSEDSNYCFQLRDSGLLKVEYKIEPVLYYYDYVSDKRY